MRLPNKVRRVGHYLGIGWLIASLLEDSEWLRGVKTAGNFDIPSFIMGQHPDAVRYVPTGYRVLPLILPHVSSEDVFFELGCGKGRVLCYLAERRRLRKIVGVEIVPELVQIAKRNLARCKLLTPVEIVQGDVTEIDLSAGTIYFLFNPFGEETLLQVLENIRRSLTARPRKIRILYHTPECANILDNTPWLQSGDEISPSFRVWHN